MVLWVFDLDDTIYRCADPIGVRFNGLMKEEMLRRGLVAESDYAELQTRLKKSYGTNASGVAFSIHFQISFESLMASVLDQISLDQVGIKPTEGVGCIQGLPGNKMILTNAPALHAQRIVDYLGMGSVFSAIYGVDPLQRAGKPSPEAYARIPAEGNQVVIGEDMPENLLIPHQMGWTTVLLASHSAESLPPHVDMQITNFNELSVLLS